MFRSAAPSEAAIARGPSPQRRGGKGRREGRRGRERWREGGSEGGRERGREGAREGAREGGRRGGTDGRTGRTGRYGAKLACERAPRIARSARASAGEPERRWPSGLHLTPLAEEELRPPEHRHQAQTPRLSTSLLFEQRVTSTGTARSPRRFGGDVPMGHETTPVPSIAWARFGLAPRCPGRVFHVKHSASAPKLPPYRSRGAQTLQNEPRQHRRLAEARNPPPPLLRPSMPIAPSPLPGTPWKSSPPRQTSHRDATSRRTGKAAHQAQARLEAEALVDRTPRLQLPWAPLPKLRGPEAVAPSQDLRRAPVPPAPVNPPPQCRGSQKYTRLRTPGPAVQDFQLSPRRPGPPAPGPPSKPIRASRAQDSYRVSRDSRASPKTQGNPPKTPSIPKDSRAPAQTQDPPKDSRASA